MRSVSAGNVIDNMKTPFQRTCEREARDSVQRIKARRDLADRIREQYNAVHVEISEPRKLAFVWLSGKHDKGEFYPKLNETCLAVCLDGVFY